MFEQIFRSCSAHAHHRTRKGIAPLRVAGLEVALRQHFEKRVTGHILNNVATYISLSIRLLLKCRPRSNKAAHRTWKAVNFGGTVRINSRIGDGEH